MPSPGQKRLVTYVDPDTALDFERRAASVGLSVSGLLGQLVQDYLPTSDTYYVRQSGHQLMMVLAMVAALSKKSLSAEEMADVRELAKTAAAGAFGPVPPRPVTVDLGGQEDPRMAALHKLFAER